MTATIELQSARHKLQVALCDQQKAYFGHMRAWFRKRMTKEEFDVEARKLLPNDQAHLHNEFMLAILNKCQTLATFTHVTSPPAVGKTAGGPPLPLLGIRPNSASSPLSGSPSGPPGIPGGDRLVGSQQPDFGDGGRLRVGSVKRRTKSSRAMFDQRFQPLSPTTTQQDVDDVELFETEERTLGFAHREETLPDATLISGRLLLAAWEEGLDGNSNDPAAVQLMMAGVNQLLKKIIVSLLKDKTGCKVTKLDGTSVSLPTPNPYLNNTQRSKFAGHSADVDDDDSTSSSSNLNVVISGGEVSVGGNPVNIRRPQQQRPQDPELLSLWEIACSSSDRGRQGQRRLDDSGPVTLFDLLTTLKKHNTALIPSHTVYSVNLERVINRLHHSDEEEDSS